MPTEKELWVHFAEECEFLKHIIEVQRKQIEEYRNMIVNEIVRSDAE